MNAFGRIYQTILSESKVSENKINFAIDRHKLVVIRYNTHGEGVAMADRLCGIFAYGVTKAGNDCIRVFEYKGDTTTFVPGWKLIRLDRIISWHETNKTVSTPPGNPSVGEFNPNGDGSMSIVYKVANFNGQPVQVPTGNQPKTSDSVKGGVSGKQAQQAKDAQQKANDGLKPYTDKDNTPSDTPKTAQDVKGNGRAGLDGKYSDKPVMKTDTERAIDYLRRQLDNPEKIDLTSIGKKQKQEKPKERLGLGVQYGDKPVMKTGTEQGMERLKRQLQNPEKIDLSNFNRAKPVAQKPIERPGVGTQYADKPTRKTDTENAMDYLRSQLENPEKIDLSRIPKR